MTASSLFRFDHLLFVLGLILIVGSRRMLLRGTRMEQSFGLSCRLASVESVGR
jgi:hypothetical protein